MELKDLRMDYGKSSLTDPPPGTDPVIFFRDWLGDALYAGEPEANAMVLSTVSPEGMPSSRVVLLKDIDERGFIFFSNYESRKGLQLRENPQASLLFFWPELERQVRIEGLIEITENEISDAYFNTRPPDSRISAAVSPQSRQVASRAELEKMHEDFRIALGDQVPVRPQHWGGYRLVPALFEFWQGRSNRFHDRIQFSAGEKGWDSCRLAP